jgi:hypothetical protein
MKQYIQSTYHPDGDIPAPAVLEKISGEARTVEEDMRAASAGAFSAGPPDSSGASRLTHTM